MQFFLSFAATCGMWKMSVQKFGCFSEQIANVRVKKIDTGVTKQSTLGVRTNDSNFLATQLSHQTCANQLIFFEVIRNIKRIVAFSQ